MNTPMNQVIDVISDSKHISNPTNFGEYILPNSDNDTVENVTFKLMDIMRQFLDNKYYAYAFMGGWDTPTESKRANNISDAADNLDRVYMNISTVFSSVLTRWQSSVKKLSQMDAEIHKLVSASSEGALNFEKAVLVLEEAQRKGKDIERAERRYERALAHRDSILAKQKERTVESDKFANIRHEMKLIRILEHPARSIPYIVDASQKDDIDTMFSYVLTLVRDSLRFSSNQYEDMRYLNVEFSDAKLV